MPAAHGGLGRVLGKSGAAPLGGMHPASVSMEDVRDVGSDPWVGKIPWPSPVLLPGKSHGWRSLVRCSPWGRQESDTTERLHFHSSLSCIGEGNGNPLQCSCLENPRDGGALWAAVYGVAQSRTRLKRFSSSIQCYKEMLKRIILPSQERTWRKIRCILSSDISQSEKTARCTIPII